MPMSDRILGRPSIPVSVTMQGTCIAKLEDIWEVVRQFVRIYNYKVMEDYGVMGVAPFIPERAKVLLGYIKIPFDEPVGVYQ